MKFSDRYPLRHFQSTHADKLQQVMARYPLATVISQQAEFPAVSQVPLIYDEDRHVLRGHLDRNNPHCRVLGEGGNIYAIFNGPNHYISPSIYPDSQYPGWNYIAVHVEGTVRAIDDHDWLEMLLLETAAQNEPPDSGYRLSASQDNFHTLINYILGFEIDVSDMRGILKLAQDKGPRHAQIAKHHLAELTQNELTSFLDDMLAPE